MYDKIIKWWLVGILFYFPFNTLIVRYLKVRKYNAHYVQFIDEVTIVLLIFFALLQLYKDKALFNRSVLMIGISIIVFSLLTCMSGIINENSLQVTLLGTFDYIKYFLVIFIYAAFFKEFNYFRRVFQYLLIMSVIVSIFAIFQELWALVSRYLLGKDVLDPSLYFLRHKQPSSNMISAAWRFGILRAGSFLKNPNILGYFNLLIFTIYITMNRKANPWYFMILLSSIIFTVSRSAYAGLFVLFVIRFLLLKYNNRKMLIVFICLFMVFTAYFSNNQLDVDNLDIEKKGAITYRDFAARKGLQVWSDHPIIGVGPGMFGGDISIKFDSYVYDAYKYPKGLLKQIGSIDQFWPQVFAEIGVIGFILFVTMLVVVIVVMLKMRQRAASNDIKNLVTALLVFALVIYGYTFGTGFNNVSVVFPYFAFMGIALGSIISQKRELPNDELTI